MFWLVFDLGVIVGIYLSIGFALAIDNLKHIHKPTFKDRLFAEFLMIFWLPLFIIGSLINFYEYLKTGGNNG